MKTIALLAIGVALTLTGCSSSTNTDAAATTTAAHDAVRGKSCENYLPVLSKLKEASPESANKTAEETIALLPQSPQWATLSEADRQATIAGIRDAATGKC
ncbi:hypothetical protein DFR70_12945 [Nocardia tenerifensis]|uniref:Acid stress chaperone HdeA n=1 Tax=Nocardia tenerifensis TaxID=228006 RepID=A0A318JNH8_9NOCA|nr:hypothetical protein [Nocardia tenerifensis]PXX52878.1 hypothetical protein DFR70_12945 [Nocardia tenerifensis]